MWGPKRLNLLWFLRYGFPQMARYYLSIYRPMYVSYLNITVSIYWCWQGKFPEYTHFVETSSTGCRDMLGHFGGKLCHRERGRCLARHQMYQSQNASVVPGAPLKSHDRGQNSRGTLLLMPNIYVEC